MTRIKVLITGISGFLGSQMAAKLEHADYEVYGLDMRPSPRPRFVCAPLSLESLSSFNQQFDYILHFAGGASVAQSFADEGLEWRNTVQATLSVSEFHQKHNPSAHLIYPSSAAVYGIHPGLIGEEAECSPLSPYGECKLEAERHLLDYHYTSGAPLNIIRFFSIYGEGLRKQLIFDTCCRLQNIGTAAELVCYGSGEEQRDFIHVDDAVELIFMLMQQKLKQLVVNGGNGKGITVKRIIELLAAEFAYQGKVHFSKKARIGDPVSLIADNGHIRALGYSPQVEIEEGIKRYVKWYKKEY